MYKNVISLLSPSSPLARIPLYSTRPGHRRLAVQSLSLVTTDYLFRFNFDLILITSVIYSARSLSQFISFPALNGWYAGQTAMWDNESIWLSHSSQNQSFLLYAVSLIMFILHGNIPLLIRNIVLASSVIGQIDRDRTSEDFSDWPFKYWHNNTWTYCHCNIHLLT